MQYLLDTNICIYLIKNHPINVKEKFSELSLGQVGISSITLSELKYGVEKSQYVDRNRKALDNFILPLEIYSFEENASTEYGKLRVYLEKKGTPIGSMDMLIAAHALSLNMILVTNNSKEFSRVPYLKKEQWF